MPTSKVASPAAKIDQSSLRIGYETRIGSNRWAGRVVATHDTKVRDFLVAHGWPTVWRGKRFHC